VGVHQDGLVHLSEIAHRYVKNPADALNVGQAVRVKVLAIDLEAKRIALSIKALLAAPEGAGRPQPHHRRPNREGSQPKLPAGARLPRPEGPRPPRPEGPRPPRAEGSRPQGPRPPRPEGPRPPRPEGMRPPRPQEVRPPRPEREVRPKPEAGPVVPATSASLSDLMAKFNKGHR
jgi:hypothetical protein